MTIGKRMTLAVAVACAMVAAGGAMAGQSGPPAVGGTITAVGEGTVTFQASPDKTVTVAVNDDTVVKVQGKAGTLADLKVGMHAYAFVTAGQPATEIRAYAPKPTAAASTPPHKGVSGVVSAIGADSITLQPRTGAPVTVAVNAATIYMVNGMAATLADVIVGMRAGALGDPGQPAKEVHAYLPVTK